jgi:hypothetical protein
MKDTLIYLVRHSATLVDGLMLCSVDILGNRCGIINENLPRKAVNHICISG